MSCSLRFIAQQGGQSQIDLATSLLITASYIPLVPSLSILFHTSQQAVTSSFKKTTHIIPTEENWPVAQATA
jgi:hypothetical protein